MNQEKQSVAISIVVPVYGSSGTLLELHGRVSTEMQRIQKSYEIVFVDDCGPPESLHVLREIAQNCNDIVIVEMLRNVGQVSATVHGMAQSSGRLIVTIDDDLQQWPEDISKLVERLESQNVDLVVGRFQNKQHSRFRKISSEIARRIAIIALPVSKTTHFSSFRVMRREVFESYFRNERLNNASPGWMYITAPRHTEVEVRHSERSQGASTYSLSALVRNVKPLFSGLVEIGLRILVIMSVIQITISILGFIFLIFQYTRGNINSPGFTTIVMLLLTIVGILGVGVGLLAQYLRSIRELILNKPASLIRDVYRPKH